MKCTFESVNYFCVLNFCVKIFCGHPRKFLTHEDGHVRAIVVCERLPLHMEEWEAAIALRKRSNVKGRDQMQKTHVLWQLFARMLLATYPKRSHESVRCSLHEPEREISMSDV